MREMDCIEVIVEKDKYVKDGVHKGMQGWICDPNFVNGTWLVNFPQCGEKDDIAEISIKEEDMRKVPIMYAKINEEIKARFDALEQSQNAMTEEHAGNQTEDNSDYLI